MLQSKTLMQGLIDKDVMKFGPYEEKLSAVCNSLSSHKNDNADSFSNAVNNQKVMYDSSQLIETRGVLVQEEKASTKIVIVAYNKQ